MATLLSSYLHRLLRKILILLPSPRNCFLRLVQEKLRDGGFALLQHAIATFGVDVVLKGNLWIARIELERVLILLNQSWVVAIQRPVTRIHRQLLLVHTLRHVDAMSNALTVGDDQ